jgi:hypothetical protein
MHTRQIDSGTVVIIACAVGICAIIFWMVWIAYS